MQAIPSFKLFYYKGTNPQNFVLQPTPDHLLHRETTMTTPSQEHLQRIRDLGETIEKYRRYIRRQNIRITIFGMQLECAREQVRSRNDLIKLLQHRLRGQAL